MVFICIRIHPSSPDRRHITWSRAGVEPAQTSLYWSDAVRASCVEPDMMWLGHWCYAVSQRWCALRPKQPNTSMGIEMAASLEQLD